MNTDSKVNFVDGGDYGRVYRIQALGEDIALKIFYSDVKPEFKAFHGNPMEVSNAVALFHTLKPNQCSRFYCAKISLLDEKDGFLLTKFVEKDNKKYPEPDFYDYSRFLYIDARRNDGKNYIAGRLVDYGDVRPKFSIYEEQKIAKRLYPHIKKKDADGIVQLAQQYEGNEHWNSLCKKTTFFIRNIINQPEYFAQSCAKKLTKDDIQTYRAMGVDFTPVEKYNYKNLSPEDLDNMRTLGFNV